MQATQPIPMRTVSTPRLGLAAVLALAAAIAGGVFVTQVAWAPSAIDGQVSNGAALLEQRAGEYALGGSAPDAGFVQQRIGERDLGQAGSAAGQPSTKDQVSGHGFSGYR